MLGTKVLLLLVVAYVSGQDVTYCDGSNVRDQSCLPRLQGSPQLTSIPNSPIYDPKSVTVAPEIPSQPLFWPGNYYPRPRPAWSWSQPTQAPKAIETTSRENIQLVYPESSSAPPNYGSKGLDIESPVDDESGVVLQPEEVPSPLIPEGSDIEVEPQPGPFPELLPTELQDPQLFPAPQPPAPKPDYQPLQPPPAPIPLPNPSPPQPMPIPQPPAPRPDYQTLELPPAPNPLPNPSPPQPTPTPQPPAPRPDYQPLQLPPAPIPLVNPSPTQPMPIPQTPAPRPDYQPLELPPAPIPLHNPSPPQSMPISQPPAPRPVYQSLQPPPAPIPLPNPSPPQPMPIPQPPAPRPDYQTLELPPAPNPLPNPSPPQPTPTPQPPAPRPDYQPLQLPPAPIPLVNPSPTQPMPIPQTPAPRPDYQPLELPPAPIPLHNPSPPQSMPISQPPAPRPVYQSLQPPPAPIPSPNPSPPQPMPIPQPPAPRPDYQPLQPPVPEPIPVHSMPQLQSVTYPIPTPVVPIIPLDDFECNKRNAYYTIINECDAYIECQNQRAWKHTCPDGLNFNPNALYPAYPCAYPSEIKCDSTSSKQLAHPTSECPNQYGFFSISGGDCSKYIMCQEGKATVMNCPLGLVFNDLLSSCDWPENVPQCHLNAFKDFTCPIPPEHDPDRLTRYRYGNDCSLFLACQHGYPRLLKCDVGLSFDEDSQVCIDADLVNDCISRLTKYY